MMHMNRLYDKLITCVGNKKLSVRQIITKRPVVDTWVLLYQDEPVYLVKKVCKTPISFLYRRLVHIYNETNCIARPITYLEDNTIGNYLFCEWINGELIDTSDFSFNVVGSLKETMEQLHGCSLAFFEEKGVFCKEYDSYKQNIANEREEWPDIKKLIFEKLLNMPRPLMRDAYVHNDLHLKNVIIKKKQAFLIDNVDCMIGDPYRDFAFSVAIHKKEENDFWNKYLNEAIHGENDETWISIKFYTLLKTFHMIKSCTDGYDDSVHYNSFLLRSLKNSYGEKLEGFKPLWM